LKFFWLACAAQKFASQQILSNAPPVAASPGEFHFLKKQGPFQVHQSRYAWQAVGMPKPRYLCPIAEDANFSMMESQRDRQSPKKFREMAKSAGAPRKGLSRNANERLIWS
jgi:hypothetical protein